MSKTETDVTTTGPGPTRPRPVRNHLGGKLRIERIHREMPDGRFRTADDRGEVAWPIAGRSFEYLHVIEFSRPGVRRGLHVHHHHSESLYVFRGRLRLAARDLASGESVVVALKAGDFAHMGPGVADAFEAAEPTIALSAGRGSGPTEDTKRTADLAKLLDEE